MNKLDKILALIGAGIAFLSVVILAIFKVFQPISLMILLFVVFLVYYFKGESIVVLNLEDRGTPSISIRKLADIHIWITFLVLCFSLVAIRISEDAIMRPLWLIICLTIPSILILLQVMFKVYKLPGGEVALFIQCLVFMLTISVSSIITFPYNGGDTWAHLFNAELVIKSQSLNGVQGIYRNFPLFPAIIALVSTTTGMAVDQSARVIVVFASIASAVLMYSLAKDYYGSIQRSLLIVLILIASKWFVYWNTLVVSMTISIFLFTGFYVLLNSRLFASDVLKTILLYIVAIISPFFHPVGSVAIIILCGVYWFVDSILFNKDKKVKARNLIILVIFVIVVTLTQWMYYGQTFEFAMKNLVISILQDTPASIGLGSSINDPFTYALDNINFYILLCLAIIEVLRQIRIRQDRLCLYSGLCGLTFVGFAYVTELVNFQAVLPYRWLFLGTLLLVIPASAIPVALMRAKSPINKFLLVGVFTVFIFFGYANKDVNRDHPILGTRMTERYELTYSEFAGVKFIENNMPLIQSSVKVDFRLWDYLKLHIKDPKIAYWRGISLNSTNIIFSVRDVYRNHQAYFLGDSVGIVDEAIPNLNLVYDSGDFKWFEWVPLPNRKSP